MPSRSEVLEQLVNLIVAIERDHPVRVAIDGVDAAGKTTLADELTPLIESRGRPVIRASIDGFHNPKEIRYRQGAESPQGYYRDSFNYQAVINKVLIPLGPEGDRKFIQIVYDYQIGQSVKESPKEAARNSILLFDGIFLLRPELLKNWDFRIFIDVDFSVSVPRAVRRDLINNPGDSETDILARYRRRYVLGQRLYLETARPQEYADILFNNNNLDVPTIALRNPTN